LNKKYQIFISSTYEDMKEERDNAVQAILEMKHIPAGMESFSGQHKQQLDTIKSWIDTSGNKSAKPRGSGQSPESCVKVQIPLS